ncbi:MAG: outer membrane lipoprotein-sorting protein [bacterium]|nr:outer membrane lipoprotein-sorting protein [bacterium]
MNIDRFNHVTRIAILPNHFRCMQYIFLLLLAIFSHLVVVDSHAETSVASKVDSLSSKEATTIISEAVHYWRGVSSVTLAEMRIHHKSYDRTYKLKSWTRGDDFSLVKFIEPARDAGTATLHRGEAIWSYSPKSAKVVRIPSSMMFRSWMGSDFSYRDLARADDIIRYYDHNLVGVKAENGKKVYHIRSIPKEDSPVVWGREDFLVREDKIVLLHEFYDQEGKLVKRMEALDIGELGGRLYPLLMRMMNVETGEWTELRHLEAEFDLELGDNLFRVEGLGK